jgi:hypothetical protein
VVLGSVCTIGCCELCVTVLVTSKCYLSVMKQDWISEGTSTIIDSYTWSTANPHHTKCRFFSPVKHIQLIVKKHIHGDMFRLYRAIIKLFCKNRSISNYQYIWDPKCLQWWYMQCVYCMSLFLKIQIEININTVLILISINISINIVLLLITIWILEREQHTVYALHVPSL